MNTLSYPKVRISWQPCTHLVSKQDGIAEVLRLIGFLFPKQLTVGVLNATLDLAALVLVGVVGFLGSEVVLSPVVSHCLRLSPFM